MKALRVILFCACFPAAATAEEEKAITSSITGNLYRPARLEPTPERQAKLKVAKGFTIAVFARGLEAPRMMAGTPEGRLYITRRGEKGAVLMSDDGGGVIYRISNSAKEDEKKVLEPEPAGTEKS